MLQNSPHINQNRAIDFNFAKPVASRHRGWLRYFVAAMSAGLGVAQAQEQTVLQYWWVMPRETPEIAPRVIRVIGAKGESYEEVTDEYLGSLKADPVLMQARVEYQAELRKQAMEIAGSLKSAGMPPVVAYEEAWVQVYRRNWLKGASRADRCQLEAMLERLASDETALNTFTEDEKRWIVEALMEGDDRLDTKLGQELLARLARSLRAMGYGRLSANSAAQDELMRLFIEGMNNGLDSMTAYRDALFKGNRDRIIRHTLTGYMPPWGVGMGGAATYRQSAPKSPTTTQRSANTPQQAVSLDLSTPVKKQNQLAGLNGTLLPKSERPGKDDAGQTEEEEDKDDEKEEEKEQVAQNSSSSQTSSAGVAGGAAPMMMSRSFSLRRSAEPTSTYATSTVDLDDADLYVDGTAVLYFSKDGLTPTTSTKIKANNEKQEKRRVYTVESYGSYDGTVKWTTISNDRTNIGFWVGNGNFKKPDKNKTSTDPSTNYVSTKVNIVEIDDNDKLYMGGADYLGITRVKSGTTNAYLGSYLNQAVTYGLGHLSGKGTLTLVSHAASGQTSIYSFSDANIVSEGWFQGTLQFGASQGGNVQLNLATVGEANVSNTSWTGTVFDLTPVSVASHTGSAGSVNNSKVILNLRHDVTIAGLKGGNSNSTVTSQADGSDISPTLTLGENSSSEYTYDGTFNRAYYATTTTSKSDSAPLNLTKVGSNTQIISQAVEASVEGNAALVGSFNLLTVNDGTLIFKKNLESSKVRALGGTLQVDGNLTVTGGEEASSQNVALQIQNGAVVTVASGNTAAYNANVLSGSTLVTKNLSVDHILHVDGGKTLVDVDKLTASHVYVSNAAKLDVQQSIAVDSGIEIGNASHVGTSQLISHGTLSTTDLRLRSDAVLSSYSDVTVNGDVHLHAGAVWEMHGDSNSVTGTMYLEDAKAGSPVILRGDGAVLTMPGVLDFARSSWTGNEALISLEGIDGKGGVTLDFSYGVHLRNIGFELTEGQCLTLASTNGGTTGWYFSDGGSVTVWDAAGKSYHAELGTSDDAAQNITLTIRHEVKEPLKIGDGSLVYIEMYSNATAPAVPHLAYTSAKYNTTSGSWTSTTGNAYDSSNLLKFSNVQMSEGALLYMGELDKGDSTTDYRADHHFGGNIVISTTASTTDALVLNGQIGEWGHWYLDGHLSVENKRKANLKLVAHHSNTDASVTAGTVTKGNVTTKTEVFGKASVFSFTNSEDPHSWMSGTVSLANPQGGTVQLNVGNVNVSGQGDTRWSGAVIDLRTDVYADHANASNKSGEAARLVLGLEGDATVAGLLGDKDSYVVSNRRENSNLPNHTLTLGENSSESYTFGGTIGDGYFYTGGTAYKTTTTTKTTGTNTEGETVNTEVVTVQEVNVLDSRNGSLNLVKVGTNTQEFSGTAILGNVEVKAGALTFSGTADIESLVLHSGASMTTKNLTLDSATLYGGSSWTTTLTAPSAYNTSFYLVDVYGEGGETSSITLNSSADRASAWVSSLYLNMQDAGTWTENSGAIFTLSGTTKMDLNKPRVITNMSGIYGGARIALYENWTGAAPTGEDLVLVEDTSGGFYDARYEVENGVLYVVLSEHAGDYGIVINNQDVHKDLFGYIWSGENNGYVVDNNVHYLNMTMGSVWRADGSAENTGWHEQRAVGSTNNDVGVYKNGNAVYFLDTNVHGEEENHRKVDIKGAVAPGTIYVMADNNAGTNGSSEAVMQFGYAFVSTDGTGSIVDISDSERTSIIKEGDSLLIINTSNTFSGGIDVRDGGLYLAAVGAAGTGTLKFHTDQKWSYKVAGSDLKVSAEMERVGAELMICYPHSDEAVSGFRGSTLANDIVLVDSNPLSSETDVTEGFKISFAHASFNEKSTNDDHANVPRHWRNLTLSGALVGSGYWDESQPNNPIWVNTSGNQELVLTGYSSTWTNNRDQSYVTSFTLNEDTATQSLYITQGGDVVNRFAGKVVLQNTINTSPLPSNELSKRTAGTVQVTLKGDKLVDAELDMTREQEKWTNESSPRQTYNNILVINGDATLRGLSAKFLGSGYIYNNGQFNNTNANSSERNYAATLAQTSEVWHVRTVTNGLNTLQLGEYRDSDNETYVYSGAMGFAQAYAGTSQAHVPWGDGFDLHSEDWYFGTHSKATPTLSLTKASSSTQYIHTALLQDLSVYEGKLGFNNVEVQGNMNLVGGSYLTLGVTSAAGWNPNYGTHNANYEKRTTSDTATLQSGKTLTVITLSTEEKKGNVVPTTATVEGNLDMSANTSLTFRTNGVMPDSLAVGTSTAAHEGDIQALMTITGTLTLASAGESGTVLSTGNGTSLNQLLQSLNVTLTGLDFSQTDYTTQRYYLLRADEIKIGTQNDERYFTPTTISLGYGYFGTLYTVGNMGSSLAADNDKASSYDYLVMTVNGDPRRTWHGLLNSSTVESDEYDFTEPNYTWSTGSAGDADYRWKENLPFYNGQVVLFGNLYQPQEWEIDSNLPGGNVLDSDDTVKVTSTVRQVGTLVQETDEYAAGRKFDIDDHSLTNHTGTSGFQAVKVEGEVAPFSLIVNSDYWLDDNTVSSTDSTNYYFFTNLDANGKPLGHIRNATPEELAARGFDESWQTMLHKTGEGILVMELDNRYTGGSVLQGGRTVMKHVNALGFVYNTGAYASDYDAEGDLKEPTSDCTITLMNNAALQGDFDDDDFPGNRVEEGNVSLGKAMKTTTIHNKVVVNVYADPGTAYNTQVDGRLINSYDKKLILTTLEGESDTVLQLSGVGLSAEDSLKMYGRDDMFRYGVFKVLDPSKFYGTITMSGNIWDCDDSTAGGRVQLDIMSTTKSADGADWSNAVIDLTVNSGTERTVLALDATGVASDRPYEYCVLDSITGSILANGGSSSVLNISAHNPITLVLKGLRNGDYDGNLGYGDFQVAVNYGGYDESLQGSTQHHYGAVGYGSLNLIKEGEGSVQKVQRAWLNSLKVQGGVFAVEEALVAHDITAGRGKRVMVGNADTSSLYALTVGAGGTLAMNTTFAESGTKVDALANLEAGTTLGDSNTWVAWVLLENGATLSAREDWYTAKQIDIATGAAVTVNTHNFAIDPYINESNDVFGKYGKSHIIQLLGNLVGRNVTLNVVNQLTNPNNKDAIREDVESQYMGYVAINDHNDFTGDANYVNVGDMTVLQILGSNDGVEAGVDITVKGKNATLQVVDKQQQYVDTLVLGANNLDKTTNDPLKRHNNGQMILGGKEVTTLVPDNSTYLTQPDTAGQRVVVAARHDEKVLSSGSKACDEEATIEHLHVDLTGSSVKMGGAEGHHAVATNVHVDVVDKGATHTIHHTDVVNSIIHLQEDCSINIADVVNVDYQSAIAGVLVDNAAGVVSPVGAGPSAATGENNNTWTKEVTTSSDTTVQLTFANDSAVKYTLNDSASVLVLQAEQFQGVDVVGGGLTLQLHEDMITMGYNAGAQYIAVMVDGGSGRFLYEQENQNFDSLLDSEFVLLDQNGKNMEGYWISSYTVTAETKVNVSMHMLYFRVPEPTTTTLSLLALTALCARRRRK